MGGVSRYFFTCIGVRGRFDSPEIFIVMAFLPKENSVFGRFSSLPPKSPPPVKNAIFIVVVVSPSLTFCGMSDREWPQHCRKIC